MIVKKIMMFENMNNNKLGKKNNRLTLLKKLEVYYNILKSNEFILLDINIQIKIII